MSQHRTALVTGSGGGIGSAICRKLAASGHCIVVADIDAEGAEAVSRAINEGGGTARALAIDVASGQSVRDGFDGAARAFGTPDVVVAAAGVVTRTSFLDLTEDQFDFVLNINLRGAFLVMQEAARRMIAVERPGSIVAISSMCGERADPFSPHAHYDASKGGLNQLVRSAASELGRRGIRVNAIAPGRIDTPLLRKDPDHVRKVTERIPLGQYGRPEDVADLVDFLASERSCYITGAVLPVDGGWTAH